jgi:BMFP domain-containing protein YqiC
MKINSIINEIAQRVSSLIPDNDDIREELRTKVEQTVKSAFNKLEVLSSEEFESQAQTLKRAEHRIAELESLINELEKQINKKGV